MASIEIKLSQSVFDQDPNCLSDASSLNPSDFYNSILPQRDGLYVFDNLQSWRYAAGQLTLRMSGNETLVFRGQVNPDYRTFAEEYGTGSARSATYRVPGQFVERIDGDIGFDYAVFNRSVLELSHRSTRVLSFRHDSLYEDDPLLGKTYWEIESSTLTSGSGPLAGYVFSMEVGGSKFLDHSRLSGVFGSYQGLTGDAQVWQVWGDTSTFENVYKDGSYLKFETNASAQVGEAFSPDLFADAALWSTDDEFDIDLPDVLPDVVNFNAGDGNDVIRVKGGGGQLFIDAGEGDDTIVMRDLAPVVDGGAGVDTVQTALTAFDLTVTSNVENLEYTGRLAAQLSGNELDNVISGGRGGDVLFGRGGNDTMDGQGGRDTALYVGLRDNFTIDWSGGVLTVTDTVGDEGTDTLTNMEVLQFADGSNVYGTDRSDRLSGTLADDDLYGGAGNDRYIARDGNNRVYDLEGNNRVVTGDGDDQVELGLGNDNVNVGGGNNVVDAGEGNNQIRSLAGDDVIASGTGNDRIIAGDGDNVITSLGGNNNIRTGIGNDSITTGDGNDRIIAGDGDNVITSVGGNNNVRTGIGNDSITTGDGNDQIRSSGGDNHVSSGDGIDRIFMGIGDDFIEAGAGNDKVQGGAGADILIGGLGIDLLTGGADADLFVFDNLGEFGADKIRDFKSAEGDKLVFDQSVFDGLSSSDMLSGFGTLDAGQLHLGSLETATAETRLIFNAGNKQLWYDADGSGSGFDAVHVATLLGVSNLLTDDFTVVSTVADAWAS